MSKTDVGVEVTKQEIYEHLASLSNITRGFPKVERESFFDGYKIALHHFGVLDFFSKKDKHELERYIHNLT